MFAHTDVGNGRPSNLNIWCLDCTKEIPYDPYNSSSLCSSCQVDEEQRSIPAFVPGGMSSSTMASTPDTKRRRLEAVYDASPSPRKQVLPNGRIGYIHDVRTHAPQGSRLGSKADMSADDDEDEFVDAQEEQSTELGEAMDVDQADGSGDNSSDSPSEHSDEGIEDANAVAVDQQEGETSGYDGATSEAESGHEQQDQNEDEENDLFQSTFRNQCSRDSESEGEDEDGKMHEVTTEDRESEVVEVVDSREALGKSEHTNGCTGSRGPATPADSRSTVSTTASLGPPDEINDLSFSLKRFKAFHNKAKDLIPRLPLGDDRYWVGVLHLDKSHNHFSKEKDFTWMKANRLTTVETVWNKYSENTAVDEFVLLLGWESVDFKEKVEQLDYFSEKKIFFRAVYTKDEGSKGRSIVGLDQYLAQEAAKQKKREQGKGKGIKSEPVVIDDD